MSQNWNVSGGVDIPANIAFADYLTALKYGVQNALTGYYGDSNPSTSAPTSWGQAELGTIWVDGTNDAEGAGDDLGAITKRWEVLTSAPTYGFRTLGLRGYFPLEPGVSAISLSTTGPGGFLSNSISGDTSTRAIAARLLLRISYPETPTTSTYLEVRNPDTSSDPITRRCYPQVAGLFNTYETVVGLDSSIGFDWNLSLPGGGTTAAEVDVVILGYYERI